MKYSMTVLPAALLLLAGCTRPAPTKEPVTKFGIEVKGGPMDTLLLKDYTPATSLVVPRSEIAKAKYPVIDAHSHSSMSGIKSRGDVDAWLRTMDETGVERSVVFTNATGGEFERQAEMFLGAAPKRFQVWASPSFAKPDAADFSARVIAELERAHAKGARGVGELTDKGWGLEASEKNALPRAQRLRVDDPRLDAFWDKCGELNMPVNLHLADHPSCWQPLGPKQERTPDFQNFNLSSKDVPSYEELLATRERMLERHPRTKFIFCHFSNQGNDTAALARMLDKYPNMYVDLSARDYEMGRQPRTMRAFLERYKERVLFGTDMGRERGMYQRWWRLLESADEYMPGRIWWTYYGLELPDAVLKSLYRETALKVLNFQ